MKKRYINRIDKPVIYTGYYACGVLYLKDL